IRIGGTRIRKTSLFFEHILKCTISSRKYIRRTMKFSAIILVVAIGCLVTSGIAFPVEEEEQIYIEGSGERELGLGERELGNLEELNILKKCMYGNYRICH
ncbi:hypothetical protein, partial [Salmonella sp. s55004]|uniref:hypothetical protein n=1 Tax=Salmonella sp. s55004 TaxID=3159675 RepID=UPI0039819055